MQINDPNPCPKLKVENITCYCYLAKQNRNLDRLVKISILIKSKSTTYAMVELMEVANHVFALT